MPQNEYGQSDVDEAEDSSYQGSHDPIRRLGHCFISLFFCVGIWKLLRDLWTLLFCRFHIVCRRFWNKFLHYELVLWLYIARRVYIRFFFLFLVCCCCCCSKDLKYELRLYVYIRMTQIFFFVLLSPFCIHMYILWIKCKKTLIIIITTLYNESRFFFINFASFVEIR